MTINLAGIYPPIITPFTNDEAVAFDKLAFNLRRWLAQPLDGIVAPGSNSEAVHLTNTELKQICQICAPLARENDKYFIAGIRGDSTAAAIATAQMAGEAGADAVLMLPPYFFKPALTHDVLVAHFKAVAAESPVPILLYNVPVFTGIDFALATILALAEHDNIIGIKDSSTNVVKAALVLADRPDFQIFAGTGSALLPFLSLGGVGGIMALANFAAVPLRQLVNAFAAGRLAEARTIQLSLAAINTAVTARFGIPGLKYAMDRTGFYGGPPRRPLQTVGEEARQAIDALLDRLELA